LTIELKDQLIPQQFNESMENWMFGCDICQDVCPWNRFSKAHQEKRFNPDFELLNLNTNDWQALNSDHFEILFKNSAIKRTGFQGLKRNINFLKPIEKP
jgi:epoxyqueuosine reductase